MGCHARRIASFTLRIQRQVRIDPAAPIHDDDEWRPKPDLFVSSGRRELIEGQIGDHVVSFTMSSSKR